MKFISIFPVGVRQIFIAVILCYVAAQVLGRLGILDLYSYVALYSPKVWQGCVWQVFTYWLLAACILDFLMNTIFFLMLAPKLEKEWSCRELWSFCLISALGAGLAQVLLMPHSQVALTGLLGVNFGLLAAWFKLFGREEVLFLGLWTMSVRSMVLLIVVFTFVVNGVGALIPLCGGIVAWAYLAIRWRANSSVRARAHSSDRISRLEL